MLEYSRDAMGPPLRALDSILESVRSGEFLPDSTRSGRFAPERRTVSASSSHEDLRGCCSCAAQFSSLETPDKCDSCQKEVHGTPPCIGECAACGLRLCQVCRPRTHHPCADGVGDKVTSSESSAESPPSEVDPPPAPADAVQNRRTKRIHRCLPTSQGVPLCGASLRPVDVRMPPTDWAVEYLCRRTHCYPCGQDP